MLATYIHRQNTHCIYVYIHTYIDGCACAFHVFWCVVCYQGPAPTGYMHIIPSGLLKITPPANEAKTSVAQHYPTR